MLAYSLLPTPQQTPLVRQGAVWLKMEGYQHTGSVKYRMVYERVVAACVAGELTSASVLTEVTSGSTGVALAYVGAQLGVRVELHAYANACPQKCAQIRAYGASLVLHPLETPMPQLLAHIADLVVQHGYWHVNQYSRQAGVTAYRALATEIVQQWQACSTSCPEVFASPVGTGGLIQGVGSSLRQVWPGLRVVAVEPEPHVVIAGIRNTQALYLGPEDPYDRNFPDHRVTVLPPQQPWYVDGQRLGESAAAVYAMVQEAAWPNVMMIVPDFLV